MNPNQNTGEMAVRGRLTQDSVRKLLEQIVSGRTVQRVIIEAGSKQQSVRTKVSGGGDQTVVAELAGGGVACAGAAVDEVALDIGQGTAWLVRGCSLAALCAETLLSTETTVQQDQIDQTVISGISRAVLSAY
ncbi:hypothetical protein O3P69_000712 [Scylla paramamosain]|uniref:Uncharacterized protein n=1 Tax=Scylla paramamosain TaxID=85552 RepID=A0AAW0URE1_SCYPA